MPNVTAVQDAEGTGTSTGPTATWGSATTEGSLLVASICYRGGDSSTISEDSGDWTLAWEDHGSPNGVIAMAQYYILDAASRSGAESWTIDTSIQWAVSIEEYTVPASTTYDTFYKSAADALSAAGGPASVGARDVPGGKTGVGFGAWGRTRGSTETYTRLATDGPHMFDNVVNEPIRNVTAMARLTTVWKEFNNWEMLQDGIRLGTGSGSGYAAQGGFMVFLFDTTAITAQTTGGSAAIVQSKTASSNATTSTLACNYTSLPTAGNLLVAFMYHRAVATTHVVQSGWTQVDSYQPRAYGGDVGGSTWVDLSVYTKVADSSDQNWTWDFGANCIKGVIIIEVSGTDTTLQAFKWMPYEDGSSETLANDDWASEWPGGTEDNSGLPYGPTGPVGAGYGILFNLVGDSTSVSTELTGFWTARVNESAQSSLDARLFDWKYNAASGYIYGALPVTTLSSGGNLGIIMAFGAAAPSGQAGWGWHGESPRWQVIGG